MINLQKWFTNWHRREPLLTFHECRVCTLGLPPKNCLTVYDGGSILTVMKSEEAGSRSDQRAGACDDATDDHPRLALRTFAHPLRLQMLSLLTGATMSAAEVARELGTTQANASYHLRRLHAAGLLEVAEEVRIRGGRARRFHHDPDSGARLQRRGPEDAMLLAEALAAELRRRTVQRQNGVPGLSTDAELWVDPDVWDQFRDAVRAASATLHREAKPPRTEGTVRVSATVALFVMNRVGHGEQPTGVKHVDQNVGQPDDVMTERTSQ